MIYVDSADAEDWESGFVHSLDIVSLLNTTEITLVLGKMQGLDELQATGTDSSYIRVLQWQRPVPSKEERWVTYGFHAGETGSPNFLVVNPQKERSIDFSSHDLALRCARLRANFSVRELEELCDEFESISGSANFSVLKKDLKSVVMGNRIISDAIGETKGESAGSVRTLSDAPGILCLWSGAPLNGAPKTLNIKAIGLMGDLVSRCGDPMRRRVFAESPHWPILIAAASGWYLRYSLYLSQSRSTSSAVLALNRASELAQWSLLFSSLKAEINQRNGKLMLDGRENPTFQILRTRTQEQYSIVHSRTPSAVIFSEIEALTNLRNRSVLGHGAGIVDPGEFNDLYSLTKGILKHLHTETAYHWFETGFSALRPVDAMNAGSALISKHIQESLCSIEYSQ